MSSASIRFGRSRTKENHYAVRLAPSIAPWEACARCRPRFLSVQRDHFLPTPRSPEINKYADELKATAAAIAAPGKGILAADESSGTIGKRFSHINVSISTCCSQSDRAPRSCTLMRRQSLATLATLVTKSTLMCLPGLPCGHVSPLPRPFW